MSETIITQAINYEEISRKAVTALRDAFGTEAGVFAEPGYQGRVRLKLVTPRLNGVPEPEKQDAVWRILTKVLAEEAQSVSFVVAYGTDEL